MEQIGIFFTQQSCYSYPNCITGGTFFSSIFEKSTKKCNYIVEIKGLIYMLEKIFAISPEPVCIVRKLKVKPMKSSSFSFQVLAYKFSNYPNVRISTYAVETLELSLHW